ncbi:MAG TPA: EamA family transporter [Armatimonadota bacterium]|jgi:multidrug transporter EmrE-like cation transporter
MAVAILILAICLGALGQILLKYGLGKLTPDSAPPGYHPAVGQVLASIFTNGYVFCGFASYAISSLFYLVALSRLDLSFAYPLIALSYVIVTVLAWQLLHEPVPGARVVGLAIIMVGVVIVGLTQVKPTQPGPGAPPAAVERPAPPPAH